MCSKGGEQLVPVLEVWIEGMWAERDVGPLHRNEFRKFLAEKFAGPLCGSDGDPAHDVGINPRCDEEGIWVSGDVDVGYAGQQDPQLVPVVGINVVNGVERIWCAVSELAEGFQSDPVDGIAGENHQSVFQQR